MPCPAGMLKQTDRGVIMGTRMALLAVAAAASMLGMGAVVAQGQ